MSKLLEGIKVSKVGDKVFSAASTSLWRPPTARGVFGGQILGQSVSAASATTSFPLHSLHAYFLLSGSPDSDILYKVSPLRSSRSFETRVVVAEQNGAAIYNAEMSYGKQPEEGSKTLSHQVGFPVVPNPDNLPSLKHVLDDIIADSRFPDNLKPLLTNYFQNQPVQLDIKFCTNVNFFKPKAIKPAVQQMWIKADAALPDDQKLHKCFVAYASDWAISTTALLPHKLNVLSPTIHLLASLDHSLWFYDDFRADEWMLYHFESPVANNGRGLNIGKIFRRDGALVACAAQEALYRIKDSPLL